LLGGRFESLDELLANSDIVSLHVPLTPETTHMMGKVQFSKMKKSAYLINASRGAVVDEAALIEALNNGTIAGAALDVFEKEPLPTDSRLSRLPNVIITPHVASVSAQGAARISQMIAEDIVRIQKGESPKRFV
jgi:phosphoglycerate dehydrogenase-like enzyme